MKHLNLFLWLIAICFSVSQLKAQEADLGQLTKMKTGLRNRRISSHDQTGNNSDYMPTIKVGETRTIAQIAGSGVINHIWITIAPRPDRLNRSDVIIRMYWDGNNYPSVESPIGPFFGQGWNEQYNYSSVALAAGPDDGTALISYFAMPFAKGARIEIENQSNVEIEKFYFYVDYYETKETPKDVGRFHAWYNQKLTNALPEGETEWGIVGTPQNNKTGEKNYVFADIKGKGHFVGINYYVHSPTPMWYGEGDDMWFIDGDKSPSLNGTGTEDFFNTSWAPKLKFANPYFGAPRVNDDFGFLGRTHVYRFFINDPVYFEKSLKATIETGHDNNLTLDIATVAYWYQSEACSLPTAPSKEVRKLKPFINPVDAHKWRHEWRKSKGNGSTLWGNE